IEQGIVSRRPPARSAGCQGPQPVPVSRSRLVLMARRKRGGDTRQTPGKRKPGNYLHHNGTPINGFGDDGNSDNLNGTPARQRGFGSNLGFSTEKDQLRASLAHAQRTINTLRGALQRKKEDALRVKKSSVISLGDTVKASDMLVRDNWMMMMMMSTTTMTTILKINSL
ncbi:uncharacterized protein VP01_10854g2, partial [Puccinia sorghi]